MFYLFFLMNFVVPSLYALQLFVLYIPYMYVYATIGKLTIVKHVCTHDDSGVGRI